jgi:hypothetical protein
MSWGPVLDDANDGAPRRRVGLATSAAFAATIGAGGELTVHAVVRDLAPAWNAARFPLLAAVALAVAQLPRGRRVRIHPTKTLLARPHRSPLSRHLDKHARRRRAD